MLIRKFNSVDEIHKIWNDETFIRYIKITDLISQANLSLNNNQRNKLFPDIPNYVIINNKVYEIKEYLYLKRKPTKEVDNSSYCEIKLTEIKNNDEIKNILKAYNEEYKGYI